MAQAHQTRLLIGPIATATGLTPDAVRYYERLGLLPKAPRTNAGFRLYSPDTIERIQFIRRAQQFGLALREIRQLLAPANGQRREQCKHVRAVLEQHLADLEARIRELQAFRRTLQGAVTECDRALRLKEIV
jgi:DNA-binding transcriptional MerR regulator